MYSLSRLLGISQATVKAYFAGRTPSVPFLEALLRAFPDISAEWLLMGEGEPLKDPESSQERNAEEVTPVPFFDTAYSCGFSFVGNSTSHPTAYIALPQLAGQSVDAVITAYGDSMQPAINNGDMVALKRVNDIAAGVLFGEIYAVETEDFSTIKRIDKADSRDCYRLHPLNTDGYSDNDVPLSAIKMCYRVVAVFSVRQF